jgi:protein-tyrosine phosphatase
MGRRREKKAKVAKAAKGRAFLDPSMDEIQNYLEAEMLEESMATQLPMLVKKGSKAAGGWQGGANVPQSNNQWPNGYSYSGNSGYISGPTCDHTGSKVVFEHEGKALYASSWQGLKEYSDQWNLIIDLAGNVRPKSDTSSKFVRSLSTVPKALLEKLESFVPKPEPQVMTAQLLSLDWTDMGIPPVELDFWQHLWEALPAKTVIACHGGHGRTGTALCALMITAGVEDYWGAIEHVRKEHCKKAVESLKQEQYLHELYVDKLRFEHALAVYEGREADVADLAADIEAALADVPGAKNSTASKQTTAVATNDNNYATMQFGSVIDTQVVNGIVMEHRCTTMGCPIVACHNPAHLTWLERRGTMVTA